MDAAQLRSPQEATVEDANSADQSANRAAMMAFLLDDATEAALRGGLADHLSNVGIRRGGIRAATKALKSEASPRILLVDLSGLEDDPVRALDDLAAVCSPDIKVIVLGDRSDIEFYRLVTRRLGVDEYLRKPLTRDAVSSLIGPYLIGNQPKQDRNRGGRVIAVCGARGGAGATTIAANLALQVSELTRSHVALLDLHLQNGHSAMMLGVQAISGLRGALENPDHVDGLLLDRVGVAINDRLRLIAAEEALDENPQPTAVGLVRVIELLRNRFNVIVIDMPMPLAGPFREAVMQARQALLVMNPDLASLRDVQRTKRSINGLIGAGRVITVLNRATMPGGIKLQMVQDALGAKPEIIIPDLPKQILQAANLGQPALKASPALGRALSPLTQEVSGVDLRVGGNKLLRLLKRS